MDETAYRQARDAVNPQPCAFEKAVLIGFCACPLALRRNIAEREAVACRDDLARAQCVVLRALLRQSSAFALRHTRIDVPLPHAGEMKVQCGGLQGLQQAVAPAADVADVAALVRMAQEKFGSLENLPYSKIVQSIVAFLPRKRREKR